MLKSLAVAISLSTAVVVAAHAQAPTVRRRIAPEPLATPGQAEMMKLQMAMVAAQQAAIKPGDEALPCEALQTEMVSTMNDPAIQAYAATTNAAYAKELASQQKKRVMTADAAAALAAALTPGAAGMVPMAPIVPGQTMTPAQMQQAMIAQQQASIAYMNQLMPIMPALMRSQRVTMLAAMKSCPWAGGLGLYPNAVQPRTIPAIPAGLPKR
jgi:hypothetical protein